MGKIIRDPGDKRIAVVLDIADMLNEEVFLEKDGVMQALGPLNLAIRNLAWRKLHLHGQGVVHRPWKYSDVAAEDGAAVVRFYTEPPHVPDPPKE